MGVALLIHLLAVVIWVGGMFFAHVMLRPVAASQLEPPVRLRLWVGVFGRFFPVVWGAILLILVTGFWIIFSVYGGMSALGMSVHLMLGLGIGMMLIFFHIFFSPYRKLKQAVDAQDWPAGAARLAKIRMLVGINTVLGLLVVAIASGGRYLLV